MFKLTANTIHGFSDIETPSYREAFLWMQRFWDRNEIDSQEYNRIMDRLESQRVSLNAKETEFNQVPAGRFA